MAWYNVKKGGYAEMNNIVITSDCNDPSALAKKEILKNYLWDDINWFQATESLNIGLNNNIPTEGLYTYIDGHHKIELNPFIFNRNELVWKHTIFHELMHFDNCCRYPLIKKMHTLRKIDYAILIPCVFVIELLAWLKSYSQYQIDVQEYYQPMQFNLNVPCHTPQAIHNLLYNYAIICAISIYKRANQSDSLIKQLRFPNEQLKKIFIDLFTATWRTCKNVPTNETLEYFYQSDVIPATDLIGKYFGLLN